ARNQMNAVLLPSGRVIATGGSQSYEIPSPEGKRADLYDPLTDRFSSAGSATWSRLYHSTAFLLPDATVASVGSNPGLSATPGNRQVSLSWAPVTGATSYRVKRSPVSDGPYAVVGCATSTGYADTGLTNGARYFYVVSAAFSSGPNAGGEVPDSTQAGATACDH